ncbi:MAG: metallophosphoesterase [Clostridia bacterium]|nr:metallophosphoesterase [Clostridia bacterium]
MTMLSGFFVKFLAMLVSAFYLIGAPAAVADGETLTPPDDCNLSFHVISDVHMETNNLYRKNIYVRCLRNMQRYAPDADALIMTGDNVMNGQALENAILYGLTARLSPAKILLPVCGNHDTGNLSGRFDETYARYVRYVNVFSGLPAVDKNYYSAEINGYTFLSLASEADTDFLGYMSDTQYQWFASSLAAAAEDGKPVFVLSHYPLSWWNVGEADTESLVDTVKQYRNVYILCGHLHPNYVIETQREESVWEFCLPRLTECDEDTGETYGGTGVGMSFSVTDTAVVIRTVNFYTGRILSERTEPIV